MMANSYQNVVEVVVDARVSDLILAKFGLIPG
jgi:hypothetical protein